jgi:hypothetical protein
VDSTADLFGLVSRMFTVLRRLGMMFSQLTYMEGMIVFGFDSV